MIRLRHRIPRVMAVSLWAVLAAWLLALPAAAQEPVSVSATLNATSAVIGDFLDYGVTVSAPPGTMTTLTGMAAALKEAGLEPVGVTPTHLLGPTPSAPEPPDPPDPDELHRSRPGERELTSRKWRLGAFKLGEVALGGIQVKYRTPDGLEGDVDVPPLSLQVIPVELPPGVEFAEGQLFGIKTPVALEVEPERRWLTALLIVLAGVLLALAVWRPDLLRRLLGRGEKPAPPPPPADVAALEALTRLVAEGLLDRGLVREYYGRLSEIFRTYLDRRFGLHSREATTDEMLPVIRKHPRLGLDWYEAARRFLTTCDLAKFARHSPPKSESEELTSFARTFVRQTRPEPEDGADGDSSGGNLEQSREVVS